MPTQQGPNRALTESSADQFYLIRQLNFQKLVLASQFLFARYFLRLAREVVPLYWHCVVAFDALFHQLDQVPGVLLSLFDFANSQFRGISFQQCNSTIMSKQIIILFSAFRYQLPWVQQLWKIIENSTPLTEVELQVLHTLQ
ncbi:Hypothetical_protein [Hexamita inflata]|uniref:Hypothetical_protein n=1 Tax=Hexamita inflata TaxID=28002 RepID=A0ABP1HGI7_9EUKA